MKRSEALIDRDPEVRKIAGSLGIAGPNLKAKLCDAAEQRVARRMELLRIQPETLATLDDVQSVVLDMTGVRVERIESDDDLSRIASKYRKAQPVLPVQLELEFRAQTEALVFRDEGADPRTPTFTAVVDARGERRFRSWFAERHEPAHLLVPDPSGHVAWRRTTTERPEPVEQVVDAIAARVGFWEPLVRPALMAALPREHSVLQAFECVRQALAPEASLEASYRALVQLAPFPLTVLRAELDCRRSDRTNAEGSFALRAVKIIRNAAAERAGIIVWQNFRVPTHSVIHEAREDLSGIIHVQDDDLNAWRTEAGQSLSRTARRVRITARGGWATIEVAA